MSSDPKKLGATGDFPHGKIDADDEGGIRLMVVADPSRSIVAIDFGTPVHWIGLDLATTRQFIEMLRHHANVLERELRARAHLDG